MIRGFAAVAGAALIFLASTSCRTASDVVVLPRLEPGANPTGQVVTLKGRLFRSGACLAVEGGGSTVVVWPVARAEARGGGGTTIIVWPRTATAEARTGGGGTVVVVWPFRRPDPPVRTDEEVELSGIIMIDDISGYARIPDDPGCRGERYLVVREARPAASDGLSFPRLRQNASVQGPVTRVAGMLANKDGFVRCCGNVIVVWPYSAALERSGGGGTVVIIWSRAAGSGPRIRIGDRIELTGQAVEDCTSLPLAEPMTGSCRGPAFVVQEARRVEGN